MWTVSSLSTGTMCLVQPRLTELVCHGLYCLTNKMYCNTCTVHVVVIIILMPSAEIFPLYGKSHLSSANNKQAETEGSTKMKVHHKHRSMITGAYEHCEAARWSWYIICHFCAYMNRLRIFFLPVMQAPGLPGEYEVRYSPNCLRGTNTGMRGNTYIAVARFTVDTVWNRKNSPSWLRLKPF